MVPQFIKRTNYLTDYTFKKFSNTRSVSTSIYLNAFATMNFGLGVRCYTYVTEIIFLFIVTAITDKLRKRTKPLICPG